MMKRFKWFFLGVVATLSFLLALSIFGVKTTNLSLYRAVIDLVSVGAGVATMAALGFAYVTYKSWSIPIKLSRLEKCADLIEQRSIKLGLAAADVKKHLVKRDLRCMFNDSVMLDNVHSQRIMFNLRLVGLDDASDVIFNSLLKYMPVELEQDNDGDELVGFDMPSEARMRYINGLNANQMAMNAVVNELTKVQGPSGRL
ncbi:hypothetical protein [Shewanella algae]|uniref:hypothetical protein n=1 Tax=Shewanella algae TaxID=38313 RepID=UPI00118266CC|nr:hypothetical protein [Shewanella algae]TVL50437.1 hypothetical protein AYI99_08905 [Shewanella algae]